MTSLMLHAAMHHMEATVGQAETGFDPRHELNYNAFDPVTQYRFESPWNPANRYNFDCPWCRWRVGGG